MKKMSNILFEKCISVIMFISILVTSVWYAPIDVCIDAAEAESYSLGTVYTTNIAMDWENDVEVIEEKSEWKYLMGTAETDVSEGWNNIEFDDSSWQIGKAPFGDRDNYATSWTGNNKYIWIRKNFTIENVADFAESRMEIITFYDDNPKFYLNGHLVYIDDSGDAWNNSYEYRDLGNVYSQYLVEGTNVIAIQCSNDTGGRQIDTSVTFVKSNRINHEIFGIKEEWSYFKGTAQTDIDTNWYKKDFDSSSWEKGEAPFGDREGYQTPWNGTDKYIWIRKEFVVENLSQFEGCMLALNTFYDDNPKFYLNGELIYSPSGWVDSYTDILRNKYVEDCLVEGTNVIAIQCSNDTGGRQIDTSLSAVRYSEKDIFWQDTASKTYGVYAVKGLQSSEIEEGKMDNSLVQSDVIGTNDTYEVIYEPGNNLYFYFNPRMGGTDLENNVFMWSSGDEQWGATGYNESIVKYVDKYQATVQYQLPKNLDFGDADYVTTQIGCQVYNRTDFENEDWKNGVLKNNVTPLITIYFNVRVLKSREIFVEDTIKDNGCIKVREPQYGMTYEWEKSTDGVNWQAVSEKRYDLDIITDSGQKLNVAMDLGGGMYYRVRAVGTNQWSHPYKIPYYNNIQNGNFEAPAMYTPGESGAIFPFNPYADEQQYPNGFPGIIWKTTGPGWVRNDGSYRVTCDIEIVNGRKLKTDAGGMQGAFSVPIDEMYVDGEGEIKNGDQFAELNCENIGALYQDILTMPNAECYWELDHAGRHAQNSMYVVAMPVQDAELYSDQDKLNEIITAAENANLADNKVKFEVGTEIVLTEDISATVWKVTSPEQMGIWEHHSGMYQVSEGESSYLTRFFFVSTNDVKDPTVGNLLDNVTFEMQKEYNIEYYVDDEIKPVHTISGLVNPYERVYIPTTITQMDLSKYTLYMVTMNGRNYYLDEAERMMTVAYGNDDLKLYYKQATIAVNKKVVGLDEIPDGYEVVFKLTDSYGNVLRSQTVDKSQFTKIERLSGDEIPGYFTTIIFDGTELSISDGEQLYVTETIKPKHGQNIYLKNAAVSGKTFDSPSNWDYTVNIAKEYSSDYFEYHTNAGNEVSFVNTYVVAYDIYVTKRVSGDLYDLGYDKNKTFDFTINVSDNGKSVDVFAWSYDVNKLAQGYLKFSLTNSVMMYVVTVIEGYDVEIIEEDCGGVYSTSWLNTTTGVKTEGRNVVLEDISANTYLTCTNISAFEGEVEVQGFQMNTDTSEGAVSEHSPSFRVVSRASKMLRGSDGKLHMVRSFGTIYALDSSLKSKYDMLRLENAYDGQDDTIEANDTDIFYTQATDAGIYQNWTTKQPDNEYYNYFALTFVMKSYTYKSLESDIAFRAYAVLDNNEIVYGTKVYSTNIYKIAENLYQNRKISSKPGHDFLYTNVLNLVTMDKNRVSICKSMLGVLEVNDKSSDEYVMINTVNHDINDYVYCQKSYTYSGRTEFVPNNTDVEVLLGLLNGKTKTEYKTLFDWIYNETPKYGYNGYYKIVPYDWDDSIFMK